MRFLVTRHALALSCLLFTSACESHPRVKAAGAGEAKGEVRDAGPDTERPKIKVAPAVDRKKRAVGFAKRAPAGTVVYVHVEHASQGFGDNLFADEQSAKMLANCGITSLPRLDLAFAATDSWVVELSGGVGLDSLACVLGLPKPESGALDLGGAVVSQPEPGTVRATPKGYKPTRDKVRTRLNELYGSSSFDGDITVATRAGPYRVRGKTVADKTVLRFEAETLEQAKAIAAVFKGATVENKEIVRQRTALRRNKGIDLPVPKADVALDGKVATVIARAPDMALLLRVALVESFSIPSDSMRPSILRGDHLFVLKGPLRGPLERGAQIAFFSPEDNKTTLLKRVVAVAGDSVEFLDNQLLVNGKPLKTISSSSESFDHLDEYGRFAGREKVQRVKLDLPGRQIEIYRKSCESSRDCIRSGIEECRQDTKTCSLPCFGPVEVPKDSLFVMGNYWDNSRDSRVFGSVPKSNVIGTVGSIFWSMGPGIRWERIGLTPR